MPSAVIVSDVSQVIGVVAPAGSAPEKAAEAPAPANSAHDVAKLYREPVQ